MKKERLKYAAIVLAASLPSISIADETGWGRDHDIPDTQPPTEMEITTTEGLLQQILELFGVDAE